jgi:hypothetical protein
MTAGAGVGGDALTLADPLAEALRVVEVAADAGLLVRLMGGMAIRAHAPDWTARTRRMEVDLDFVTVARDRSAFFTLLESEGYTPDRQHNALFGRKQGYFVDVPRKRPVDVLVDTLEMCHRLDFGHRLGMSIPTLPLADLLLTKLQVVKINRKDVLDALVLLAEHPLGPSDGVPDSTHGRGTISIPRMVEITANDWGWWRTVTGNLDKLAQFLETELREDDLDVGGGRPVRFDPASQVRVLREALDAAPKSARWRLRARVGDRVPWYNEPEEVGHAL